MLRKLILSIAALTLGIISAWPVFAEDTVKIGVLEAMSGPQQSTGVQTLAAMKLYMQQHSGTPDGTLILGRGAGFVRVWAANKLEPVKSDLNRISDVSQARFSPTGKFIVTGLRDGTALVWESYTGERITELGANLEQLALRGPAMFAFFRSDVVSIGRALHWR